MPLKKNKNGPFLKILIRKRLFIDYVDYEFFPRNNL